MKHLTSRLCCSAAQLYAAVLLAAPLFAIPVANTERYELIRNPNCLLDLLPSLDIRVFNLTKLRVFNKAKSLLVAYREELRHRQEFRGVTV